jgi:primosomal protein N'
MLSSFLQNAFEDLKRLPQRQDYHPEKWVFDHKAYVWHGVHNMFDYSGSRLKEMELVAAFHDVGKLDTTERHNSDGRLVSYRHAERSGRWFDAVAPFVCEEGVRSQVVSFLIKNHMKIKFKHNMNENKLQAMKDEAQSLGQGVWQMLNEFNLCDDMLSFFDRHGMEHFEVEEPSDDVEVFERHEEAISRFQSYVDQLTDRVRSQEPNANKDLWLVRGVPGSGKTTITNKLASSRGEAVAADQFFVDENGTYNFDKSKLGDAHKWCKRRTELYMEQGVSSVFVHNTFTQPWEMVDYYALASKHGYQVFSIIAENRHMGESEHGVPSRAVHNMINRFKISL